MYILIPSCEACEALPREVMVLAVGLRVRTVPREEKNLQGNERGRKQSNRYKLFGYKSYRSKSPRMTRREVKAQRASGMPREELSYN